MPDNFKFVGFDPTGELKTLTREILWLVEDKSPSQSARMGQIEKTDSGYRGNLRVSSSAGVFEADSIGSDPTLCIERLYSKMKLVLKDWAKGRVKASDKNIDIF